MRARVIMFAGLTAAMPALAAPETLTGESIKAVLSGSTLNLDTPAGIPLPVHFQDDGTMTAVAGKLAFFLGSRKDSGKWWIKGSKLCQQWKRWLDGEESCIRVTQDGNKFSWRSDDGKTGTAKMLTPGHPRPQLPPAFALGGPRANDKADEPSRDPDDKAGPMADGTGLEKVRPEAPPQLLASLEPAGPATNSPRPNIENAARGFPTVELIVPSSAAVQATLIRQLWGKSSEVNWCRDEKLSVAELGECMPDLMIVSRRRLITAGPTKIEGACMTLKPPLLAAGSSWTALR